MSQTHKGGNLQPQLDLEEHFARGNVNTKAVSLWAYSAATDTLVPLSTGPDGIATSGSQPYAIIIDDATTNTVYLGKAPVASATSSAVWQIAKLNTASGIIKTWADGDANFDNIWDDRATLTYL